MKKKTVLWTAIGVAALGGAGLFVFGGSSSKDGSTAPHIKATRMTLVEKALAVGTIEPEFEISVKSKVSGAVKRIFADAGTFVRAGQPLLEVKPDPTPLELAEAKRNLELSQVDMDNVNKDQGRRKSMLAKHLISDKEYDDFVQLYEQTRLRLSLNRDRGSALGMSAFAIRC